MPTTKQLVLQMDYNSKRGGDVDNWGWDDAPYPLRGETQAARTEDAKRYVKRSGTSRVIRGWRVVERTAVITDVVVEELTNG